MLAVNSATGAREILVKAMIHKDPNAREQMRRVLRADGVIDSVGIQNLNWTAESRFKVITGIKPVS